MATLPTMIIPPTPQRPARLRHLYRAAAHLSYAGGVTLTLTASALMVGSAALSTVAGAALTLGEGLRDRALGLLTLGHPAAAVAHRARQEFYARRRQGLALD